MEDEAEPGSLLVLIMGKLFLSQDTWLAYYLGVF